LKAQRKKRAHKIHGIARGRAQCRRTYYTLKNAEKAGFAPARAARARHPASNPFTLPIAPRPAAGCS
jgi:hypothetical protein